MQMLPPIILSFFAQMKGDIRMDIGGDPDTLIDIPKQELIKGLGQRFRFRGVTKKIDQALQLRQLSQTLAPFLPMLAPIEQRFALQLMLEMMDVRGWSGILSLEGGQQIAGDRKSTRLNSSHGYIS